jgi:cobalt-precorrin 5A hydrolase
MIVAGVGFRRNCSVDDLLSVVRATMARSGTAAIDCLATADFKRGAACLHEAAAALGVEVALVGEPALAAAAPRCLTQSRHVQAITGHASIAEAACLAAAGPGSRLLQPRLAAARATCALAAS